MELLYNWIMMALVVTTKLKSKLFLDLLVNNVP